MRRVFAEKFVYQFARDESEKLRHGVWSEVDWQTGFPRLSETARSMQRFSFWRNFVKTVPDAGNLENRIFFL